MFHSSSVRHSPRASSRSRSSSSGNSSSSSDLAASSGRPAKNIVNPRASAALDFGFGWDSTVLDRLQAPLTRYHE